MHSIEEMGSNVPAFLAKLWKIVVDPETNDLISWSPGGKSFFIRNQAEFSRELLPVYYKHNNMASFVRQLNMYGFHKVVSIEGGGLKVDKDEMEFAHPCFLMGHPYLLEHIKRKIPTTKSEESRTGQKPDVVNKVLSEVKTMKGRQDSVDAQLSAMKRENEVLWREVAILRQKHLKQQQIVNKLIQFLVSMVQTSRSSGIGIKRHYPLMLSDITHRSSKSPKLNGNISDFNDVPSNPSPTGPVIHELDPAELLDDSVPSTDSGPEGPEFLSTNLCNAADNGEVHSPAPSPGSSKGSATINLNEPNCDVLLELVGDYKLSPDILMTASPAEVNPCVTSSKDRNKTIGVKNNRKRKARPVPVKEIIQKMEEEEPLNVCDFLEIVLPTLDSTVVNVNASDTVNNADLDIVDISTSGAVHNTGMGVTTSDTVNNTSMGVIDVDSAEHEQNSLAAATDAAIPAITAVTAPSSEIPEDDDQGKNLSIASNLTLACASNNSPENNTITRCGVFKEDLDSHLGNMQSELETLKDLLKGEGYSLDANALLGLFADDPLAFGIPIVQDTETDEQNKKNSTTDPMVSGSELATYSTSLLDLVDLCGNSGLEDWTLPDTQSIEDDGDMNTPQVVLLNSPDFSGTISKKEKK